MGTRNTSQKLLPSCIFIHALLLPIKDIKNQVQKRQFLCWILYCQGITRWFLWEMHTEQKTPFGDWMAPVVVSALIVKPGSWSLLVFGIVVPVLSRLNVHLETPEDHRNGIGAWGCVSLVIGAGTFFNNAEWGILERFLNYLSAINSHEIGQIFFHQLTCA